jgi:flagellar hook-length control protein FliK
MTMPMIASAPPATTAARPADAGRAAASRRGSGGEAGADAFTTALSEAINTDDEAGAGEAEAPVAVVVPPAVVTPAAVAPAEAAVVPAEAAELPVAPVVPTAHPDAAAPDASAPTTQATPTTSATVGPTQQGSPVPVEPGTGEPSSESGPNRAALLGQQPAQAGTAQAGTAQAGAVSSDAAQAGVPPTGVSAPGVPATGATPTTVDARGTVGAPGTSAPTGTGVPADPAATRIDGFAQVDLATADDSPVTSVAAVASADLGPESSVIGGQESKISAVAAAPSAPSAPVAPVAATASSATPAAPGTPAQQVATHIVPLRLDADGIHRLTVHLHPADLGPVSLVAEIRDGTVAMQLTGSTEAGREALRAALPDLRRELTESGFRDCQLDLRQDGGQPDQQLRQPMGRNARADRAGADPAAATPEPTTRTGVRDTAARRLDVHA